MHCKVLVLAILLSLGLTIILKNTRGRETMSASAIENANRIYKDIYNEVLGRTSPAVSPTVQPVPPVKQAGLLNGHGSNVSFLPDFSRLGLLGKLLPEGTTEYDPRAIYEKTAEARSLLAPDEQSELNIVPVLEPDEQDDGYYENQVRSMHENPARYIFTNVKAKPGERFSSAFGPGQITYTLAEEVFKALGDSEEDAEYRDYLNSFIQQGKARVNQLQNQRTHPTGKVDKNLRGKAHGRMHIDDHKIFYPRLFEDALQIKINRAGSDPREIFKHWYGHKDKKKMASYLKETMNKYGGEKNLNIPKIMSIITERETGPLKDGQ